jgi:hypothetical protein
MTKPTAAADTTRTAIAPVNAVTQVAIRLSR